MKSMHGVRNRLVRRMHQHANMTGLFRFSETLQSGSARAAEPGMASAADATGLPLAKAFMPMPEPAEQANLAPSVLAAPAAQNTSPTLPLERPKPASARIEPPQPVPSGNVFRAPETDRVELPIAEEHSQPAEDDHVWHRLQNIFNKHRDKKAPQEAASLPQPQEGPISPPEPSAPTTEEIGRTSASLKPELPESNEPGLPSLHSVLTKREATSSLSEKPVQPPSLGIEEETGLTQAKQEPESVEASSVTSAPTDVIQAAAESSPQLICQPQPGRMKPLPPNPMPTY